MDLLFLDGGDALVLGYADSGDGGGDYLRRLNLSQNHYPVGVRFCLILNSGGYLSPLPWEMGGIAEQHLLLISSVVDGC